MRKVQFGLGQLRVGPGPRQFGLELCHIILRVDRFAFALGRPLALAVLQFASLASADVASRFAL